MCPLDSKGELHFTQTLNKVWWFLSPTNLPWIWTGNLKVKRIHHPHVRAACASQNLHQEFGVTGWLKSSHPPSSLQTFPIPVGSDMNTQPRVCLAELLVSINTTNTKSDPRFLPHAKGLQLNFSKQDFKEVFITAGVITELPVKTHKGWGI